MEEEARSATPLEAPGEAVHAAKAASPAQRRKAPRKAGGAEGGGGGERQTGEAAARDVAAREGKDSESDGDSFFAHGGGKGGRGGAGDSAEGAASWREPDRVIDDFKVWVGDLPWSCSEESVEADFARFGEVLRFDMPRNKKGLPDGVAFIYYADEKAMNKALALDGQDFHGKNIKVKRAAAQNRPRQKDDAGKTSDELTVFVGGLPYSTEEDDLRKSFSECGEIEVIRMLRGPGGNFKGIAFIAYRTLKAVRKALLWDGEEFQGRRIKVAKPQERQRGEGGAEEGRGKDVVKGKGQGRGQGKGQGKGKAGDQTASTVFVGSLPADADMETLRADFADCGPVDRVRMVRDADGHFKGAAFVVFRSPAGARKALEWNGQFFYGGRAIKVAPARQGEKPPKD